MRNKLKKLYQNPAIRRYQKVVAFAILGAVLGALLVAGSGYRLSWHQASPAEEIVTESTSLTTGPLMNEAEPVRLRIPAINLDTGFYGPVGVDANQELDIPDDYVDVGWYEHGPTPGELGPAVVLGHVDSYQGPAVFFHLGQLKSGDEIFVDRLDGTTAVFTVTELERPSQTAFPTEKVYGNLDYAGLRLITCTGTFDHGIRRYSHNLVVFAELSRTE